METVTVRWTTTVEETHTAEIPRDEYEAMVNAGTYADDLAEYEGDGPISSEVTDREISL